MSLVVLYEAGVDATYEDISDRFRNYTLDVTQNAEEGAVALSSVTIDDPTGNYEIKGYRRLAIYENAATGSNTLLYNGFIVDRKVIRGPYQTGAGRQWVCSVADTNVVAEFRVMVGSDANRPAETDVARMQWLMSTSEMSRIPNTTFLNTSSPVQMDAVDYRGQKANDVLNDCAQASGKNHFTFAIDGTPAPLPAAPGATHIWYDFADSTARTSSIRLSNVHADITGDASGLTYAIADDTELERDPSRVFSGAIVNYDGGMVYEESLAISNEFTRRDAIVPASNIKTNAKATARATRYLSEMSTEEDRIRTAIRLPAARVNWVREGMRVQFKATHLPGYEAFVWQRVLRRTIKQDSEEEYLVTLELGTGPSTPQGTFVQDATAASDGQGVDVVLQQDPTPGNLLVAFMIIRSATAVGAITQTGWTAIPSTSGIHLDPLGSGGNGDLYAYYKIAQASDTTTIHLGNQLQIQKSGYVAEFSGIDTFVGSTNREDVAPTTPISLGPVTPSGSGNLAIGAFIVAGPGVSGGNTHANVDLTGSYTERHNSDTQNQTDPDANTSLTPMYVVGYRILPDNSATTMTATYQQGVFAEGPWGGILLVFS